VLMMPTNHQEQLLLFYTDDGLLATSNHVWLHMALLCLCKHFERVCVCMSMQKTRAITCTPGYISGKITLLVYQCWMDSVGKS
jgi:hypothetical protein